MSCRSSHVIKLKLSSQLIGQLGHVTASASCEKHSNLKSTVGQQRSRDQEAPQGQRSNLQSCLIQDCSGVFQLPLLQKRLIAAILRAIELIHLPLKMATMVK